ncbi:MAG: hypothetical protein HZC54_00950 [Verrucomicrobia bacterium]|nr:hypothetical protein [Verrucomicrobiota bacterium]
MESGLLLSALMLTGVVLENSTRELLVRYTAKAAALKDVSVRETHEVDPEKFYEESKSPRWGFSKMIDHLVALGLLAARRADKFKQFYTKTRIPLHHGLVRRISGGDDPFGGLLRDTMLEELIEERGIEIIKKGVSLVESLDRIARRAEIIAANPVIGIISPTFAMSGQPLSSATHVITQPGGNP